MSTLKVNTIRHTGASSDAVTLASDGTCTAKITNNLSNRNLIINGDFRIAQRGTSSTSNGYATVDRWRADSSGTDEATTKEQVDVASGTTPYTLGFRKAWKITNGNQTGGAGAGDDCRISYFVEAQDLAQSGWNYTSASSYVTLSFWVKSSVAQNFYGYVRSYDGTAQSYPFETGSLSADTWTKVTKTIPGHANIQIDNDNDRGFSLFIDQFRGTDDTGSVSLNAWGVYSSSARTPDQTSTWWTTNDATWEITGVQLEVGEVATDFEHKSYGDELLRCQRYFNLIADGSKGTGKMISDGFWWSNNEVDFMYTFPVEMRLAPTIYQVMDTAHVQVQGGGVSPTLDGNWTLQYMTNRGSSHYTGKTGGGTSGNSLHLTVNNAAMRLGYNAEL